MTNRMPLVNWFEDIGMDSRPTVGGKGGSLGELVRAGIRVPPGYVVTTGAFRRFMARLDPGGGIRKAVADIMEGARAGTPAEARRFARVADEVGHYRRASPEKLAAEIRALEKRMFEHARNLEFEEAARLRDEVRRLREVNLGAVEA